MSDSRKHKFWDYVSKMVPLTYAGVVSISTILYQFGIVEKEQVGTYCIITNNVCTGSLILAGLGITGIRKFNDRFDTWWTQNSEYRAGNHVSELGESNYFFDETYMDSVGPII